MAPQISQAIIALSGAITGIVCIAGVTYLRHRNRLPSNNRSSHHHSNTTETSNSVSSRSNRLRRSRHARRRRNRNGQNENERSNISETEEDADNGKMLSLFKEWGDDDNRNLLTLLHAISENQSRKEGFIHRGITCNKCNMSPIRGVRYKCANCTDFDLCEMCEGANSHVNTHVFLKIRIPIPPLANPRSALLSAFYPGKYHNKPPLSSEKYRSLQHTSHFDQVELEALYEQFKSLSSVDREDGGIDRETFEQCLGPLGLEKNLITERIFAFFDRDGDNVINFAEMVAGLSVLCKGNLDEKIEYAFRGYDLDEDGYISRDELYRMYKAYFYLSMELVRDVVSAMEDEMMNSYEFSASQPVSAAFNVAMPSTTSDRSNSDDEDDNEEDNDVMDSGLENDTAAGPSKKKYASTDTLDEKKHHQTDGPRKKRYPLKEDHFLRQYAVEAEQARALSNASEAQVNTIVDDVLRSDSQRLHLSKNYKKDTQEQTSNSAPTTTTTAVTAADIWDSNNTQQGNMSSTSSSSSSSKKAWEEKFPIMETMSQGAINQMVDKTFKSIDTEREGYINFEEFKECVQLDSSIVSWFEALGTVF